MTLVNLLTLALFSWYVAYVLVKTSGPFNMFGRLRAATTLGGLLECVYCLVVWVAAVGYLLLYVTPFAPVVYIGAVAGAAMLAHRYTGALYKSLLRLSPTRRRKFLISPRRQSHLCCIKRLNLSARNHANPRCRLSGVTTRPNNAA
jgi:hypothetical protein